MAAAGGADRRSARTAAGRPLHSLEGPELVGGAAELAGRVEGGPDDQAVGDDVVPGRDRPVLASSTRIPRILLPIDWPALVAWK